MEKKEEESGELDLTGLDDDELDRMILNEDEVKIKTTIWLRMNAEFLKELKELAEKKQREIEENKNKPEKKKRKVNRKKAVKIEAQTAGEAIEKMLQEKKISSKINYDVLKGLQTDASKPSQSAPLPDILSSGGLEVTPVKLKSRFRKASVSIDIKKEEFPKKRVKIEPITKTEQQIEAIVEKIETMEEKPLEIIVESGPVQYEQEQEEEDIYDEEEHMSAAKLLGHGDIDEYDGYDDD